MVISIDSEIISDKIQYWFVKTLSKLEIEEDFLNIIKDSYKKTIFRSSPFEIRNNIKIPNTTISLQYCPGNTIQCKKSGKKGIQIGKGEIKVLIKK